MSKLNKSRYVRKSKSYAGWWVEGKVYEVSYRGGKARLIDEDGDSMFIHECEDYFKKHFEKYED